MITRGSNKLESVTRAPPGDAGASLRCPAPAEWQPLRGDFGSTEGCFSASDLGGRLNRSDAFLISCPIAASYLRSCAKEDATFEDVFISFLLFSFKGKKKELPLTNQQGSELGRDASSLYSDCLCLLTELGFLVRQSYRSCIVKVFPSLAAGLHALEGKCY